MPEIGSPKSNNISGNIAELRGVYQSGNSSTLGSNVNLDWMMALRSRNGQRGDQSSKSPKLKSQIDSGNDQVPSCYYTPVKKPKKVYKENEYKGNFSDISHLTKKDVKGINTGSAELSQASFVCMLRKYDDTKKNKTNSREKNFDSLISREKSAVDFNHNVGSTFLPPINQDSKK